MMTSQNGSIVEKRDLHVGGLGSGMAAGSAMVSEPALDASEQLLRKAQQLARSADDYLHDNPWAAVGMVALLGVAAGYFLSRRY